VSTLSREIEEQPLALARLLDQQWSTVSAVADAVRAFAPEWIQIAARGTSDNAARYAQYLFGVNNGLAVGLASPSLLTIYGAFPRVGRALTIGISQSGQSRRRLRARRAEAVAAHLAITTTLSRLWRRQPGTRIGRRARGVGPATKTHTTSSGAGHAERGARRAAAAPPARARAGGRGRGARRLRRSSRALGF
jgi:glucosamine 6-phosphate synthetase-like amidotransferase/phosphosugar isomerase protein